MTGKSRPQAESLFGLCERLGCDEIVMGAHGRSVLAELLLGSTVTKVIHLSRVPVLLVK
jgi:nucleotide-binding universal stress UspA family protein